MNKTTNGKMKLFRSGLTKESSGQVIIGGADLSDLPSKQAILNQKVEEAITNVKDISDDIVKEAQEKAQNILKTAEDNAEGIRQQAYDEGYKQGYQDGLNSINEELAKYIVEASKILEAIKKEREECLEDEETRVYKIIITIAKEIFKKDFSINEEVSLKYIKNCISKLEHKSTVNLLVSAELAAKLNQVKQEIMQNSPGLENLSITACSKMQFGDLIVESNKERLDYRLDTVFSEILEENLKK